MGLEAAAELVFNCVSKFKSRAHEYSSRPKDRRFSSADRGGKEEGASTMELTVLWFCINFSSSVRDAGDCCAGTDSVTGASLEGFTTGSNVAAS